METREYMTVQEFARLLRVHQKTVSRWIEEGKIAYWQVGNSRSIRIPVKELQRHLRPAWIKKDIKDHRVVDKRAGCLYEVN